MAEAVLTPELLEKVYTGCLDEGRPVYLDKSLPLIDPSVEEKTKPPFRVFSPTEALIARRGLRNHLGITYIGTKKASNKEDDALDAAAKSVAQVAGFVTHATRSLESLGQIYFPATGTWRSAGKIKFSATTPVLAELLLSEESFNINEFTLLANSKAKRLRLVEMFEALGEMDAKTLYSKCDAGLAIHRNRRVVWKEELANARPHRVMHDIIQRERERRGQKE